MSLSRELAGLEGDLLSALEDLPVAAYLLDEHRRIRWMNAAAMRMFGDLRGRHAEAAVVPEDVNLVRKVATRKLLGQAQTTEFEARFVLADGSVIAAEVSSVALKGDRHVVGIFGLIRPLRQAKPAERRKSTLTPRQHEVLRLLGAGLSTKQIAGELHLAPETVRNHVRGMLRALDAHSRLEALAVARDEQLI